MAKRLGHNVQVTVIVDVCQLTFQVPLTRVHHLLGEITGAVPVEYG